MRHLRFIALPKLFHINRLQKNNTLHAMQVIYQPIYGPKSLTWQWLQSISSKVTIILHHSNIPRYTQCPVDSAAKRREPFKNISFRKKYFTDKKQKIELCKIKTTFQQSSYIYFSHNSQVPSGISPEKRKGCDYNWIFPLKRVINIQSNIQLFSWW